MAKFVTQIQGRSVIKQVLHNPTACLSKYQVDPYRMNSFGMRSHFTFQKEADAMRLASYYNGLPAPTIGIFTAQIPFTLSFRYLSYLVRKFPWTVGLITTASKAVLADVIAQKLIEKKSKWNYKRTGVYFCFGIIYGGIICQGLYSVIYPTLFCSRFPKLNALGSMLTDNFINTPFILFPILYVMKEAGDVERALKKYWAEIYEASMTGWKIWIPAHMITFGVIPIHLRIPFVSVISFFFYTIVSSQQTKFEERRFEPLT